MDKYIAAHRIAAEKALLDRLRDLPIGTLNKATAAFYSKEPLAGSCLTDCMQNAAIALADALEAKP